MTGRRGNRCAISPPRCAFFLLASAGLALAGCGAAPRPNILLIVIDTARADRFSFNGYAKETSPRIAALAREGTLYTNAYTPPPWTLPAHASLFTGLYPSAHGADAGNLRLDDDLPFLAKSLQSAGYLTVGYTGLVTLRIDRWLTWRSEHPGARGQPFFIFVNYFEPHLPYNPPEPERSRFLSSPADPGAVDRLRRFKHPAEVKQILGAGDLTEDDFRVLSDLYDGEIAYVDRRVGEIVNLLRREEILDSTLVAVTSDHGEMLGEHGLIDHKLSIHEPLLRIPMVVRYPARFPAGRRIETPVMLQDLHPTILRIAGVDPVPDDRAGAVGSRPEAGILPGLTMARDPVGREEAARGGEPPGIAEYARPTEFLEVMRTVVPDVDTSPWDRTLVAYRSGSDKLHWASDGRHLLFDLESDPGETDDLVARPPIGLAAIP